MFLLLTALASLAPWFQADAGPRGDVQDGAAGLGDPYYPAMGNGGYDVAHYALEFDFDLNANRMTASAAVRATASVGLRSFHLDLADFLEVSGVRVDGAPAEFAHDGRELVVTPAGALASGDEFQVVVEYSGTPQGVPDPALHFGPGDEPMKIGLTRWESGFFTLSQPSGAPSFFPCNDHPRDKATFEFAVTVDEPWTVAANGRLVAVDEVGERRRFRFQPRDAMATYLVTINVAELVHHVEAGPGGLPLNYYFPPARAETLLERSAVTGEMITLFSERFGPYPFESYGAVVADEPIPGALETQTLPVYGLMAYADSVIAHELAHQWFGNNVSCADWSEIWVSEGFASYASALWTEHERGSKALANEMARSYRVIARMGVPGPGDPGVENLFGAAVYLRGGWVLHALRLSVGDEAFFRGLRTYHRRFAGSHATAEQFQRVLEECSGRDLQAVFDAWLHGESLPDVPSMGLFASEAKKQGRER